MPTGPHKSAADWQPLQLLAIALFLVLQTGCWVPFRYHGIQASKLPDSFRMPYRTAGPKLNFASLTIDPPSDYILGADDRLEVFVGGLTPEQEARPMIVQVMANGNIQLPLVGAVSVDGMNLAEAQRAIHDAYAGDYLDSPHVNVSIVEKDTTSILVLGKVNSPGVHVLPKYTNDVGHALAMAGGLAEDAADELEIHRRSLGTNTIRRIPATQEQQELRDYCTLPHGAERVIQDDGNILRIALRRDIPMELSEQDITLHDGDVVVVPSRRHEVFYVVGKLGNTNTARFTIGDRERELGVGFVLPRDREIDVVTAVAMAGYIDPIDSPSTVTVQRTAMDGKRMLILVDLIEARSDPQATVLVRPGDIIYLNPDAPWYMRRTLDRIIPNLLLDPYSFFMRRSILGRGNN